jgi:hypothetical protein
MVVATSGGERQTRFFVLVLLVMERIVSAHRVCGEVIV